MMAMHFRGSETSWFKILHTMDGERLPMKRPYIVDSLINLIDSENEEGEICGPKRRIDNSLSDEMTSNCDYILKAPMRDLHSDSVIPHGSWVSESDVIVISSDDESASSDVEVLSDSQTELYRNLLDNRTENHSEVDTDSDSDLPDISLSCKKIEHEVSNVCDGDEICAPVMGPILNPTMNGNATESALNHSAIVEVLQHYLSNMRHLGVAVPVCCKPDICVEIHHKEATPTSPHLMSLIKTMFNTGNKNLQHMALIHLCQKGVQLHKYMSLELMHLVIGFMLGMKYEKNEVPIDQKSLPEVRALAQAASLLSDQLRKHPPCKPCMLRYYKQVVEQWWKELTFKINDALKFAIKLESDSEATEENEDTVIESDKDDLNNELAQAARSHRENNEKEYFCLSGKERLHRLVFPLQFFVDLMEKDVVIWLVKFCNPKVGGSFRASTRPIVADIIWGVDQRNEGYPNQRCRDLLNSYKEMWFEPKYRRLYARMMAVIAEVMRRKFPEQQYPNVNDNCIEFAKMIYLTLKDCEVCVGKSLCSHVCDALTEIYPHWLRFHVGAFLLGVLSPATLYTLKESLMGENSLSSEQEMCFSVTLSAVLDMLQLPILSYHNLNHLEPAGENKFALSVVTEADVVYRNLLASKYSRYLAHFPK